MENNYNNLISIKFAKAQQPIFKENRGKKYIEFGINNDYPNYLLDLYSESPKHGSIVKGKAFYIFGKGFEDVPQNANTKGESWNEVMQKCILDNELFGGYYLQIIYNLLGQIKDVYHIDYQKVRTNEAQSEFFVKSDWQNNREDMRQYCAFNVNDPVGSQILFVKEYNPKGNVYPTPHYNQGLNYIESDIQISRHILGNAKDGFVPSTLINLNGGEPQEEAKEAVEKGIKKKFTGSEADRVVIMFNKSKDNAAEIVSLASTMLTKEDFTNINKLIQQEIYAAHSITSPVLFGIQSDAAFGSGNEIRDAYTVFNNVYVNSKQQQFELVFNKLMHYTGIAEEYEIQPVEPLGFEFSEIIQSQNLTKDEIREMMGKAPLDPSIKTQAQIISDNINALSPLVANKVLESMTADEIRSLAGLVPKSSIPVTSDGSMPLPTTEVNANLAAMTGRQFQQLERIKRKFEAGKLTRDQAAMMLKNSFGISDADVALFLDVNDAQNFESQDEIDFAILNEFENIYENLSDFEIVKKKPFSEAEYFADVLELTQIESNVLDLINKDKRITPEVAAKALNITIEEADAAFKSLFQKEVIKVSTKKIGQDEIIERERTSKKIDAPKPGSKTILLRYTYSGPEDDRNRPFCARMLELAKTKVWSRANIEQISERLGYSVWDRRGGWFTLPTGEHRPYCRHSWQSLTVIKKN